MWHQEVDFRKIDNLRVEQKAFQSQISNFLQD